MRNKKVFFVIASIFSIFVLAGAAFAANTANINVTSEPVRAGASCDKSGGITITFDRDTVLTDGDQITMDLTLNVTLCTDIDIVISNADTAAYADLENLVDIEDVGWDEINSDIGGPVVLTDAVAPFSSSVGGGVYFHIYGIEGQARVTIDVIGENPGASFTVGPDSEDNLAITLLAQNTNADYVGEEGIFVDSDNDGVYDESALLANNTMCIDVSNPAFTGDTVRGNFDSRSDKFTFLPSNPQIAHIAPALGIGFDACKDREPGHIELGDRITQGSDTCDAFDNEASYPGNGFCLDHVNNNMIIAASSPFDMAEYAVTMEILVNGQSGDNGVYWSSQLPLSEGYGTKDDACDATNANGAALGAATYELANRSAATPEAPHSDDCDVEADGRAVVMNIAACDLNLAAQDDFLWFNLPALNYDIDDVQEGDVVTVEITINKVPCGQLFTGIWEIGTFGCQAPGVSNTILFPYFTNMEAAESYWDGIAIVNLGSTDGTATLTIYEADGDVATMDVNVSANSSYVNLLSAMISGMTLTTSVDGTLGNARVYIRVAADFNVDGFAMMANSDTGESMGYLPRLMY